MKKRRSENYATPKIVVDTNVVMDLADALLDKNDLSSSGIFARRQLPAFVLTDAVGSELFGKNAFSLHRTDSIVQSIDEQNRIQLKPWNEAKLLLHKEQPSGMKHDQFFTTARKRYDLLDMLAKNDKLFAATTSYDAAKESRATTFSGYPKHAGECAVAKAALDLLKSGNPNVFVVANDNFAIVDILLNQDKPDQMPKIMNLHGFLSALEFAKVISFQESRSIHNRLYGAAWAHIADEGKSLSPKPEALGKAVFQAPDELAAAISAMPFTPEPAHQTPDKSARKPTSHQYRLLAEHFNHSKAHGRGAD